jgi:formylmethanofuran dehydrogenase subunit E
MSMPDLQELLDRSAARHRHICPRQVLGVRAGLAGGHILGAIVPQVDKRLLVFVETDGCFADGVEIATGASIGHRTLRHEDLGKIAVTLADTDSNRAVRIAPRLDIRQCAWNYAPGEKRHYYAMLTAYQHMPVEELFLIQEVTLKKSLAEIVSRPGYRVDCDLCGEEIINEREIKKDGLTICRTCAGGGYYELREISLQTRPQEIAYNENGQNR